MEHVVIELPEALQEGLDVSLSRCSFRGLLYPGDEGSVELWLSLQASEMEHLSTEMVTWLRHKATDQREIFIERFHPRPALPTLFRRARRSLREWLILHCGLEYTFRDKVREAFWMLIILLRLSRTIFHGPGPW